MAVIYGGYYDESTDGTSFAVAGFIAPYDSWMDVDWAWRDLLKKWKIEYFKASECVNGLEQFAQYRDDPLDQKSALKVNEWEVLQRAYTDFADVICKNKDRLIGVGATTIVKDFKRIISEDSRAHALFMDKPYYVCMQAALHAPITKMHAENQRRNSAGKLYIKPIFDSNDEYSDIAKIAYEKFREKNARAAAILLPMTYESDVDTPALQAADMLAYEVRKFATNQGLYPEREMRLHMKRLITLIDRVWKLDYDGLRFIIAQQRT
jgi:Protein of unknown function (DUF3800)